MHFHLLDFKISPKFGAFFFTPEKPAPQRHFSDIEIAFICNFTSAPSKRTQNPLQTLQITFKTVSNFQNYFQTNYRCSKLVSNHFQRSKPLSNHFQRFKGTSNPFQMLKTTFKLIFAIADCFFAPFKIKLSKISKEMIL